MHQQLLKTITLAIVLTHFGPNLNTPVQAALLSSHSLVTARVELDEIPSESIETDGPSGISLLAESPSTSDHSLGRAIAFTGLNSHALLRAATFGLADPSVARAQSSAAWRDIAFGGPSTLSQITLHFVVTGSLTAEGHGNRSSLTVGVSGTAEQGWTAGWEQQAGIVQISGPGSDQGVEVLGFDHYSVDTIAPFVINFTGRFHVDVPYNSTLGGYVWGVAMHGSSNAARFGEDSGSTTAEVGALRSLGIQQVTDSEGNSIAVTFESGLVFVPEPGTFFMVWHGLVVAALCRRIQ